MKSGDEECIAREGEHSIKELLRKPQAIINKAFQQSGYKDIEKADCCENATGIFA